MRLYFYQLTALWTGAGGNPSWAPLMAGIAYAESGGTPMSVQQTQPPETTGWGLWQITPGTKTLLTPQANARAAVTKWNAQGLTAWYMDRIWTRWKAAGSPSCPSAQTVVGWILEMTAAFAPWLVTTPPVEEEPLALAIAVGHVNGTDGPTGQFLVSPSGKIHIATPDDVALWEKPPFTAVHVGLSVEQVDSVPSA